jgi:hypothetical protein
VVAWNDYFMPAGQAAQEVVDLTQLSHSTISGNISGMDKNISFRNYQFAM